MAMLDKSPACTRSGYTIFFPDHLCSEIYLLSKRQKTSLGGLHPWGCLIKWKTECKAVMLDDKQPVSDDLHSESALLICGFVKEDSSVAPTLKNGDSLVLNTSVGQLIVSQEVQLTCLFPDCHSCCTSQLTDRHNQICSPFSPSVHLIDADSQLVWISFSWSILPALRRFYFLELLDSLLVPASTEDGTIASSEPSGITCEQLTRLEANCLNETFGYPLTSVILHFTRTLIPDSWPKSAPTTDDNRFHHLMESTLCRVLKISRTFALIKHCQSSSMASLGVGYCGSESSGLENLWNLRFQYSYRRSPAPVRDKPRGPAHLSLPVAPAEPCDWPAVGLSFSLFSALHLVILLLGLVTPLASPPGSSHLLGAYPVEVGSQVGASGNQSRDRLEEVASACSLSPRLQSFFMLVTSTDCGQVPTLGWFYTGRDPESNTTTDLVLGSHNGTWANWTGDATNKTNAQQPPVHILPVIDLVQNLSSIHSNCWFKVVENWTKLDEQQPFPTVTFCPHQPLGISQFLTCELTRLLLWLESGEPAGLKINLLLARLLGDFFIYHLVVWRTYASFLVGIAGAALRPLQQLTSIDPLQPTNCRLLFFANLNTLSVILLSTLYFIDHRSSRAGGRVSQPPLLIILTTYVSSVLRLTVALLLAATIDLTMLITVHLHTFYMYTLRISQLELRMIVAAWRLCRNRSKWNPLRCRVDTVLDMCNPPAASGGYRTVGSRMSTPGDTAAATPRKKEQSTAFKALSQTPVNEDVHLDRLLVSTLLGLAVGICLLPTTLTFYLTFGLVHLSIFCFHQLLLTCIEFALNLPVSALLAWVFSLEDSRSELIVEPSMDASPRFPFIKLQLIRPSFVQAYRKNCLIRCASLFGPRISVLEAVKRLITVTEF